MVPEIEVEDSDSDSSISNSKEVMHQPELIEQE
jgi:hypothetical protein